jgi:uncharacterized protein
MPCPDGVDIPENFKLVNQAAWEGEVQPRMKKWYREMEDADASADCRGEGSAARCINCSECPDKCPQKIDIPADVDKVRRIFEKKKSVVLTS